MDARGSDRLALEWACAQTLLGFYAALDERRYEACLDHLTHDCAWLRLGQWFFGRSEIAAVLAGRASDLVIHHVVSNIYIESVGEEVCLRSLALVFSHRATDDEAVVAMQPPLGLWKLKTTMRPSDKPLIARHEMHELMRRARPDV